MKQQFASCHPAKRPSGWGFLLTILLPGFAWNAEARPGDSYSYLDGPVQVEILEDVPRSEPFALEEAEVTERYFEPAFGFVRVPTGYSKNALPLDRSEPFVLRARFERSLPEGTYEFRLRAKGAARFYINDKLVLETAPQVANRESHDDLPPPVEREASGMRPAFPPHQDVVTEVQSDGSPQSFLLVAVIGGRGLIPVPGELSVSFGRPNQLPKLLGSDPAPALTDAEWETYAAERTGKHHLADRARRREASLETVAAWNQYHERVRQWANALPPVSTPSVADESVVYNAIDRFINARLEANGASPAPLTSDLEFLRRLTLDTIGLIPAPEEIDRFLAEPEETRRESAIDRLLQHPGWADHWVSYWQDVLAENPGILKPDLNNSGPFRWWLHQSFEDEIPFDRLVAELIEMEGSIYQGGPAGFKLATLNDAPMAAKADILSQAFLGERLSCARCHDAPHHPHTQKDTFSLAAMLHGGGLKLPESSTVPFVEGFRKPRVEVNLQPGETIEPAWPFPRLSNNPPFADWMPLSSTVPATRREVAAHLISPANERFAQVAANRVWKRFIGGGLVEPADDWDFVAPSHPELLEYLGREFVAGGYDLKALARLILTSHTYQRRPAPEDWARIGPEERLFSGPARKRMSAEQLVDSLFLCSGKEFRSEELNLNPLGNRPLSQFLNLGTPRRAWEFTALMNERDRPSLALPMAQAIVDALTTYGWRQSRQNPVTVREDAPSPMQTLLLANGVMGNRVVRLCDESAFTELALQDQPLEALVRQTFLRILSRPPSSRELSASGGLLDDVYSDRKRESAVRHIARLNGDRRVSWANHFDSESTAIRMEEERLLRAGPPPTERLTAQFRERYEDLIWSLLNSAEFTLIP